MDPRIGTAAQLQVCADVCNGMKDSSNALPSMS